MKLQTMRIYNFQSFGPQITHIDLSDLTFIIGPNGAGKTALLQALCRMFAFDAGLRRVRRSDFHVPDNEFPSQLQRDFWIEADFVFSELKSGTQYSSTIPPHFKHMRLNGINGEVIVRFRLVATMDAAGDIEDSLNYVYSSEYAKPPSLAPVRRADRDHIQLHYLPARRDPADHIDYSANALLGRLLRAMNWDTQRTKVKDLTVAISKELSSNPAVTMIGQALEHLWNSVHKGHYFSNPKVTFTASEIDALLKHLSVSFGPGHHAGQVDFSRLSDGQKSMLYLAVVLAVQAVGRATLGGDHTFDKLRLKPPVFTIIAMEEPENSLSPHYLGRIITILRNLVGGNDAQAIVATHAPSMLRRVEPTEIRYLRLNSNRQTVVKTIAMPVDNNDAFKYIREAVQAFPELYFARLVVLGEGASEEIVIPRLLKARGFPVDEYGICVVPLGGRHVNHFWRLLHGLDIPFFTLLDFDLGRYCGGWGRIKYVMDQIAINAPEVMRSQITGWPQPPDWNSPMPIGQDKTGEYWRCLENIGIFFSYPLDIDFAMISSFPNIYGVTDVDYRIAEDRDFVAVLGKSMQHLNQYTEYQKTLFIAYHRLFNITSKPATHMEALSKISDDVLLHMPPPTLGNMVNAIITELGALPE